MKKAFQDMLHGLREVNPTHAYYNGSRTSKDNEDPSWKVMKGLSECKSSESNIRRIQVKDTVKEVEDHLKTYSSAGMDISWKADARSGQWVDIIMKKNKVIRVNLENKSLKDEISYLNRVIEKWTCSKVTLDQLLSEQIPSNIVKALGGKGKRKENNPSKELLFTKADVSC
uniref:Uncharacterized protein n=1 Tax=Tanacetum cinerariifolium TaxID=118510 RepID=A0A6L2J2L3_TANCI|nr:hypothetical protein [Tanacetum cinerariifolium]